MVKHIHATIDDDKHKELVKAKDEQELTWEELLEKGREAVEG